jgi:hypothetical protein
VKNPDRFTLDVRQNYRQTVGVLDGEENARLPRDQAVARDWSCSNFGDAVDEIRMNLAERDEWLGLLAIDRANLPQKRISVALDGRARVVPGESQVESASAVGRREAPEPGAEAVN